MLQYLTFGEIVKVGLLSQEMYKLIDPNREFIDTDD